MQYKKHITLLVLIIFNIFLPGKTGYGQGENDNIIDGYDLGIHRDGDSVSYFHTNAKPDGFCATVSDKDGNLLFYSDGVNVFNRNHEIMPNGHLDTYPPFHPRPPNLVGIYFTQRTGYDTYIVPNPANNNQYYLFVQKDTVTWFNISPAKYSSRHQLSYSIIDMDGNGGLGDVLEPKNVIIDTSVSWLQAVAPSHNCNIYWLIGVDSTNGYYSRKIDMDGIGPAVYYKDSFDNYFENFTFSDPFSLGPVSKYDLKYNYSGFILDQYYNRNVLDTQHINYEDLLFLKFDDLTGTFSNEHIVHKPLPKNIEAIGASDYFYSPSATKAYELLQGKLFQFECDAEGNVDPASVYVVYDGLTQNFYNYLDSNSVNLGLFSDNSDLVNAPWWHSEYLLRGTMRQKLIIRCPDLPKAACMPEVINFSTIPFQANFDTAGFVPIASQGHLVPMPYMANVTHANDQEIDLCEGDSIALHPTITGDNYRWSTSVKTNTIMVYDSGYYTVRAITPCETQYETFHVHVIPTKPLITPGDTTICTANDSKIKLTVSHNTSNTIWNTGETTDSIMAYNTGLYYVSVSNQCGTFSDSVYITFDTGCRCMPFIPTAFTPNGDGLNDAIEIKTPCMEQHMSMHIYNRFGQEVYHIYQSGQKWDGTINGHPAPSGVYYYTLEFKPRAGTPLFKKGDITLIR